MRIRFKKQLSGSYGSVVPGDEKDVAKTTAQELIALGYAEAVDKSDAADNDDAEESPSPESDVPVIAEGEQDDEDAKARRAARRRRAD